MQDPDGSGREVGCDAGRNGGRVRPHEDTGRTAPSAGRMRGTMLRAESRGMAVAL